MKTDELIRALAAGGGKVGKDATRSRLAKAVVAGLLGSTALFAALYEVRSGMPETELSAFFWVKLIMPTAVLFAALSLIDRLARPGASTSAAWWTTLASLLVATGVAAAIVWSDAFGSSLHLSTPKMWPISWLSIAILSVPPFIATAWAMRGLAPTKLASAGAAVGILAGTEGVLVYTLHCVDTTMPYWGMSYLIGILLPALFGALAGPRLLRWS